MKDRISKKIQETKTNRKIKIIKNKKKSKKEFRKISKNKKNIEEKSRNQFKTFFFKDFKKKLNS